jgi:hypothetical protein
MAVATGRVHGLSASNSMIQAAVVQSSTASAPQLMGLSISTAGDGCLPESASLPELPVSQELDPTPKDLSSNPMSIEASLLTPASFAALTVAQHGLSSQKDYGLDPLLDFGQ